MDNVLELMLSLPWTKQVQPDGSVFYGNILELPGCMSQGSSEVETLENLDDALFLWLDQALKQGVDIPYPKE